VLPITDEVVVTAADLYADLRRRGEPTGDADLLVAATALLHGLVLVTRNTAHFSPITGLALDDWT
jgi:tRNA(fMet)-specific endonuclease VapC